MTPLQPALACLKARLHEIGVIQYGTFTLKNGETSPVYVDLRRIISYPDVLRAVATSMWQTFLAHRSTLLKQPDCLCGVPYGALPLASCLSLEQQLPMLMCRKIPKQHGAQKQVEGVFKAGQCCLVVEDVITSGSSILETVRKLRETGLIVCDVLVFVDREQGGSQALAAYGCHLYRVMSLRELSAASG